jgi:hypothetical protein
MIGDRCLIDGTGHTTPVTNLYLCGASCHPGPGVTFLPGYNCAYEIMATGAARGDSAASLTSSTTISTGRAPAAHAA